DMLISHLDSGLTFAELCVELRAMCNVCEEQPLTLKWIDDEGDPCTISSQMEMDEAFRIYGRTKPSGLLLHVFPSAPEKPGMPCPGEDRAVFSGGQLPSACFSMLETRRILRRLRVCTSPAGGVVGATDEGSCDRRWREEMRGEGRSEVCGSPDLSHLLTVHHSPEVCGSPDLSHLLTGHHSPEVCGSPDLSDLLTGHHSPEVCGSPELSDLLTGHHSPEVCGSPELSDLLTGHHSPEPSSGCERVRLKL
ncbi:hypothetical protein P4O66_022698, partial [Electrophorus voltai]